MRRAAPRRAAPSGRRRRQRSALDEEVGGARRCYTRVASAIQTSKRGSGGRCAASSEAGDERYDRSNERSSSSILNAAFALAGGFVLILPLMYPAISLGLNGLGTSHGCSRGGGGRLNRSEHI